MQEVAPLISSASADGKGLLRSWLEEVSRCDSLGSGTRDLLEISIKPLLSSLNYRYFANKFLSWAEGCQMTSSSDESAFNEFKEELEVWQLLSAEISKKFESDNISLYQFLHELDLTSKLPPKPPEAIPCFTIHASKGMEFGHVYLIGLVEDQLPSWAAVKKGDNSIEMQEERRNCFVAITRTQESLTMTYSNKVFEWKKNRPDFWQKWELSYRPSRA
jgi:DNA helicase-2/ATP-dependent DNA helicase PcrA